MLLILANWNAAQSFHLNYFVSLIVESQNLNFCFVNSGQVEDPDHVLFYTYLPSEPLSKERVEAFSDGVYAIVATLLILDIWFVILRFYCIRHFFVMFVVLVKYKIITFKITNWVNQCLFINQRLFFFTKVKIFGNPNPCCLLHTAKRTCLIHLLCRRSLTAVSSVHFWSTVRSIWHTLVPLPQSGCFGSFTTLFSCM